MRKDRDFGSYDIWVSSTDIRSTGEDRHRGQYSCRCDFGLRDNCLRYCSFHNNRMPLYHSCEIGEFNQSNKGKKKPDMEWALKEP